MTTLLPRPKKQPSTTYVEHTPVGAISAHVAGDPPLHVMVNVGKCGDGPRAAAEAIGRLLSLLLQIDDPGMPEERLRLAADQLAGIGGDGSVGFGTSRVTSLPDGIAKALREHLDRAD